MNEFSSRSHLLVTFELIQTNTSDLSVKKGKLMLVDLAGSEKMAKTGIEGVTLEESKKINKSLFALSQVIVALNEGKYVPYRDSKLTRLLEQSLGGNSKTSLIVNCSPAIINEYETLNALRFGTRAQKVQNKPTINKEYTNDQLARTIADLESRLIEKTERARILETILKEKIPHFDQTEYFDHFQMEDRFDDPETDATLRFKDQIRKKDEKVRELEAKVKDLESMMSYFDVSGSKYVPESGKKMQRGELMSPLKTNSISMNLNKVDKAHDRVMELLNTVHNIDNNVKQDVCSIVEKVESQNHILCQKIDKLKAKFSSFINEFKKAAVKDLGSLETSLEDLISKAVSGEKEETNLLNVDMIKVLSYLHMDNRKLKIELKAIKEDFVQRENEWVDQKESMKEKIETYSEKINRLRKVLGKFLTSCNKEKDADETLVKSRSSEEVDSELDQPSNERITLKPLENQRVKTSIEFRDEYSSMRDRENDEKNYHQVKKAVKRTSRTPPKPFK